MFPSLDFVVAGECLIMFVSCSLIFCAVYFFVSATELHEQLHYAGDPGLAWPERNPFSCAFYHISIIV